VQEIKLKHASLGDQISHKISAWILVLVAIVIVAILTISFALSRQMFNEQVTIWNTIAPQQILTNLIDSDYFSVEREIEFLKSTGLFSSVTIADNKKQTITQFGDDDLSSLHLILIQDNTKVVWGYYYFKPNFYHFISPFIFAAAIFFMLITFVYFIIRWRIKKSLGSEFARFNLFLTEIEKLTQRLHEVYDQDSKFQISVKSSENSEQVIINRAITRLLEEIKRSNQSLREAVASAEQRRFQDELTRTALQVAHDIASPIAVLHMFQSSSFPEENRVLIRNVVSRITDISNTLLKKAKQDFSSDSNDKLIQQMLYYFIHQVVSEKRMQYGNKVNIDFQFDKDSYQIFSFIKPSEFSRVLSNLINNSIDAIDENNRIIISLKEVDNDAVIQIQDHGKGIPASVLNQLGELGKSFGKLQGTGVGLNHAINTIKDWAGRFDIKSEEGKGTTVQLFLPKCKHPSWFSSGITLRNGQHVVIADDDESIHAVWEMKFKQFCLETGITINVMHFYTPEKLIEWNRDVTKDRNIVYLCDYEFIGSSMNGLDLIKELHIEYRSILVTSNLRDEVIARCELEGVRLLPKSIASVVAITELSKNFL
jgi:signal transduction histidine kinase